MSKVSELYGSSPSIPIGSSIPFAGAGDVPSGFLLCNGAAVSRTTYADLFTAIGTLYGTGDGSTTFNIPDFRGRFLRGYDGTRSAAIGTAQADGLPEIAGTIGDNSTPRGFVANSSMPATGAFDASIVNVSGILTTGSGGSRAIIHFNASDSNAIYGSSSYVTPYNYAVQFIIKY